MDYNTGGVYFSGGGAYQKSRGGIVVSSAHYKKHWFKKPKSFKDQILIFVNFISI